MHRFLTALLMSSALIFGQDTPAIETDQSCETCHVSDDWKADIGARFEHLTTGFELLGTHADLQCSACHQGSTLQEKHKFALSTTECSSCHVDVHRNQWGQDCERCHNNDGWALGTQEQNHDLTRFPLTGPHRSLDCQQCHVSNPSNSATLPIDCSGCHRSDYTAATAPSHVDLALSLDCETCHSAEANKWTPSQFDHLSTGFALLGMHAEADCGTCHTQAASNTPRECAGCHMTDYQSSSNPAHAEQGFPTDCNSCHSSFNWVSAFVHAQTGYILEGTHTTTACRLCHVNGQFANTPENCAGCHAGTWSATAQPVHSSAGFDQNCETCHTSSSWRPANWDHDSDTNFPLTGAHIAADCMQCHLTAPFSAQSEECYACHRMDYENSLEPDHLEAGIPQTCAVCHTTANWASEGVDHSVTAFPLIGAHAEVTCETCHDSGYDLPIVCEGCHLSDYESTASGEGPDHIHYAFEKDCLTCHDQFKWRPSYYDHNPESSGYELKGMHQELLPDNCSACHVDAAWSGIPIVCEGCHQNAFEATTEPDHATEGYPDYLCVSCHTETGWDPSIFAHELSSELCQTCHMVQYQNSSEPPHAAQGFPVNCENCHSETDWVPSPFIHNATTTGFTVDGSHVDLACNTCHADWEPAPEVRSCAASSCHLTDFQETSEPPHETMNISQTCESCHSTTAWTPSSFVHDESTTGFQLSGSHEVATCVSCHSPWAPASEVRTCAAASCHQEQYQNSTDPSHVAQGFPENLCASCHTETAWQPSIFAHETSTEQCQTCHQVQYTATTNPPHALFEFAESCEDCHTSTAWIPSSFVHDEANTGFLLAGTHEDATCVSCHSVWEPSSEVRTCASASCHQEQYQNSTDPSHVAQGFPENLCASCHTETAWRPSIFVHELSVEPCQTCHQVQYTATTDPPHAVLEFPVTCADCHVTTTWRPSSFVHDQNTTGFPLGGSHVDIGCISCHSIWEPVTEVRTCAASSCHLEQYQNSSDPPHVELGFPTTCADCHSETAWSPSSFEHTVDLTGFLLDGAHVDASCNSCHENYVPPAQVRSCAASSCHLDEFQATANPPHATMEIPQTCESCHTTTAWQPADFEHDAPNTGFPLTGAHTAVICVQCHTPWQNNSEVRTCAHSSCHLPDYQATNDPDHESASFPLQCETCHSMEAWEPAEFDHDGQYFPIYSGQHRNEWNTCSQCHANSSDYADFTCFGAGCHSPTSENNHHFDDGSWVTCNGQTYSSSGVTSAQCFFCHPNGDEDDCDHGRDIELPFRPRFLPTKSDKDRTD